MKLARYIGRGEIAIVDEPAPTCPPGGLLVKTEASGLCSGELVEWYMDRKVPHVLGHEVAGMVAESQDERFPVGCRVFAHHHAPCMHCCYCERGLHMHCAQWKRTKLEPGGMAEYFAVATENLTDTFRVDDLRAIDGALIEPLACVVKSIEASTVILSENRAERGSQDDGVTAVIGLGVMGLMHLLFLPGAIGYEINPLRLTYAKSLGLDARTPFPLAPADRIFVCPGSKPALDLAIQMARPGATIVLFAPMPPGEETPVDLNRLYFNDVRLVSSYSCGPNDTAMAADILRQGKIKAEQVVSDFIAIDDLPEAYQKMKRSEILKPMVVF